MSTAADKDTIIRDLMGFMKTEFPDTGIELTPSTDLLSDWLIDSLGIISTTLFLEEHFGVNVTRADIKAENYQTIENLSNFICKRLSGK